MKAAVALLICIVATSLVADARRVFEHPMSRKLNHHLAGGGALDYVYGSTLYGNEDRIGEYYISMDFGSPPQHFTVQVDTGSSDIAIPGKGCGAGCGHHFDSFYNPVKSNSSEAISCSSTGVQPNGLYCPKCTSKQCNYRLAYLDGSFFQADVYSDVVTIGDMKAPQVFGSITSEDSGGYGQFEPVPIDGIAGFAYSKVSEVFAPNIVDTLHEAGYIDDIFSMCMTQNGGMMTLGGVGDYHSGEIQYTPLTKEVFYNVEMTDLTVWNQTIGVESSVYNNGGCIVDSGTTLMYLPFSAFSALSSLFQQQCREHNLKGVCHGGDIFKGDCVSLTSAELAAYPTIDVHMAPDLVLPISPETYLPTGYCRDSTKYSLGIGPQSPSYGTLLGDVFMKNFLTVFDRANAQVGFAPMSNCPEQ